MTKSPGVLVLLIALSITALLVVACGAQGPASVSDVDVAQQTEKISVQGGGSYTKVSAVGLAAMMEDKDFPLINVHIPYEGEIEGTDLLIPFDEIEQNLDQLPADKEARLVIYCRSGNMSATAAQTLVGLGYTDVWDVEGGMVAWKNAGYPLVDKAR